jgi:hypothetical protein
MMCAFIKSYVYLCVAISTRSTTSRWKISKPQTLRFVSTYNLQIIHNFGKEGEQDIANQWMHCNPFRDRRLNLLSRDNERGCYRQARLQVARTIVKK